MKIIQITDLHVGEEEDDSHGVAVRRNFLKILSKAKMCQPDLLVLTGDLCLHDGKVTIYNWQKKSLDALGIPYEIIAGNHDDSVLIATVFGKEKYLQEKELYFKKKIGNKTCFFLDSAIGKLSDEQLSWLKNELKALSESIVIFIHHPILNGQVAFMERKYAMQEREKIQEILFHYQHPVLTFCGHYHVEKTISEKNITLQITPSTYVQIDDKALDFTVDHYQIAFREIIFDGAQVSTSVRYFEGIKD